MPWSRNWSQYWSRNGPNIGPVLEGLQLAGIRRMMGKLSTGSRPVQEIEMDNNTAVVLIFLIIVAGLCVFAWIGGKDK
jgi:hypothetical protein